jgi:hypothetical protein
MVLKLSIYFSNKPSAFHCVKIAIVASDNLGPFLGMCPVAPSALLILSMITSILLFAEA